MNDYKELLAELRKCKYCAKDMAKYAADAIEQLVAEYNELDNARGKLFMEYHKMKKQRDAAIACLPKSCGYCKHYNGLSCNNNDCRNISGVNTGWEWRGEQERG